MAIKTSLVEALNEENEQLRSLVQRHADAADSKENLLANNMRRDSNVNELQTVITHMRSQLYEHASDHDAATATIARLQQENVDLRATASDMTDEMNALRTKVEVLSAQLHEATARCDDERQKVLNLRTGMEESKRAISIMKDQLDRRTSVSNIDGSRRGSASQNRKASLAATNISEARRGSLNYLTGLGLTSKRLGHFDPRKQAVMDAEGNAKSAFNPSASLPASYAHELAQNKTASVLGPRRRASLPASTADFDGSASPSLGLHGASALDGSPTFSPTSRRSSLTAVRRPSLGIESPARRNSNLAQALLRFNLGEEDHNVPLARRDSATIREEDGSNLTALPGINIRRRGSANGYERRRSSIQIGSNSRRGSDKALPRLATEPSLSSSLSTTSFTSAECSLTPSEGRTPVIQGPADQEDSLFAQAAMHMNRTASHPPGVVQALSLEAAMEISGLKDIVSELKMQLMEAEESREASEACARALREFIASSVSSEPEHIKLPPLPSDSETELAAEAETERKEQERLEKQEKRSSRWGMPKLLPSLSYTSIRRDASNSIVSHLPAIVGKSPNTDQLAIPSIKSPSKGIVSEADPARKGSSPALKQPTWRTTATLRSSVASGMSDSSANPSPILVAGVPNFQSTFSSFSFSARQERTLDELDEPSSPMGSRSDSPTFESSNDGVSSTDESETESMPRTPIEPSFREMSLDDSVKNMHKEPSAGPESRANDPTMTPKAIHSF